MHIVVWTVDDRAQENLVDEFEEQLSGGLEKDPHELHIITRLPVSVNVVDMDTDNYDKVRPYKILVLHDGYERLIKLGGNSLEETD